MAKSRRSRRDRRQQSDTSIQVPASPAPKTAVPVQKTAAPAAPAPAARVTTVDFAKEYYYVYAELRKIFIITALMFAVMVGLSFVI